MNAASALPKCGWVFNHANALEEKLVQNLGLFECVEVEVVCSSDKKARSGPFECKNEREMLPSQDSFLLVKAAKIRSRESIDDNYQNPEKVLVSSQVFLLLLHALSPCRRLLFRVTSQTRHCHEKPFL
jgi:hypothetical protein